MSPSWAQEAGKRKRRMHVHWTKLWKSNVFYLLGQHRRETLFPVLPLSAKLRGEEEKCRGALLHMERAM